MPSVADRVHGARGGNPAAREMSFVFGSIRFEEPRGPF